MHGKSRRYSFHNIDQKGKKGNKMSELTAETYESMLRAICQWPLDRRFSLIQDIRNTLKPDVEISQPKQATLPRALGLLATDQPAPTDEEVQQWIEERRVRHQLDQDSIPSQ
jgi:hypothetical protein